MARRLMCPRRRSDTMVRTRVQEPGTTQEKQIVSRALYKIGRFSATRPWLIIGSWLALAILVVGSSTAFGRQLADSSDVPGLDSQDATNLLTRAQSEQAGLTAQLVLTPLDRDATFFASPEARAALADAEAAAARLPNVLDTNGPSEAVAAGPEAAIASGSVSANGRIALIRLQYPVLSELSSADLDNLKELADRAREGSPLQVELSGDLFWSFEEPASNATELVGIVAAVIILLIAFGSVIAMGLPIGMAVFGLALGVSAMTLLNYLVDIPSFAPEMAAMIGLGVGIDYALFLVTRHREFLAGGMTVAESAGRAVATAGQAVVFAGGTVVIAILGLAVAGIPYMTAAGIATSLIVLIMVISSITLLPAFLGLAGQRINGRRSRAIFRSGRGPTQNWLRWGGHVSRHAWKYAIGVTLVLVGLTAPILDLRLGFPDEGTMPESSTQRRAYDLVSEGFGPGINGPLVIAIDISEDSAIVMSLADAIEADTGIAEVTLPNINPDAGVATIVAFPTTAPQDEATVATINRLRDEIFPEVLAGSPARAHIGGQTAVVTDTAGKVSDRLPLFILAIVFLSFILLTLVFRSILVPLKAALLNLLSIGAAYGVLVMVFQWGWGAGLIGLETTAPIISFIPMFMFAVLFGLSMDYEVFLLSRVREEYLETGDNESSVIHGIASTARVITSAALIMISVFLGFVFGDDPSIKMVGLGLATAIFIDATVVRMILVPATMKLMGDANWWIPRWLDRILPRVEIEGQSNLPESEMELPDHLPTPSQEPIAVGSA